MEFANSTDESLITVCKFEIPAYLQAGEFFQSLHGDDSDETLQVPSHALKPDSVVNSAADLEHLLTSLRFWVVTKPVLEAVKFILTNNEACQPVVDRFVPDFPYLKVFQEIFDYEYYSYTDKAIVYGELLMLELLHQLGQNLSTEDANILVARSGNLEVLKFARQNGVTCNKYTFQEAVEKGHLHIVTYLHNENIRCELSCTLASQAGQLEILKFLHTHGYEWGTLCTQYAAEEGHLDCLMYLHEEGCEWDEDAFRCAAEGGHLPVLQYLHAQGAPFEPCAISSAAAGGHDDCVLFLQEAGYSVANAGKAKKRKPKKKKN